MGCLTSSAQAWLEDLFKFGRFPCLTEPARHASSSARGSVPRQAMAWSEQLWEGSGGFRVPRVAASVPGGAGGFEWLRVVRKVPKVSQGVQGVEQGFWRFAGDTTWADFCNFPAVFV